MLLHTCIGIRHGMCKPDFIVNACLEFICKTKSVIKVDAFSSSIVIQQESIVVIQITFHMLRRLDFVLVSRNFVLNIGDVLAASKPANTFFLMLILRPYARLHPRLVQTRSLSEIKHVKPNLVHLPICM